MKIGIIIYSNDAETVWNAFRFGNYAVKEGDNVAAFLIAKGVESETLDTDAFKITEQMHSLIEGGGTISACETCLAIHHFGRLGIVSDINAFRFAHYGEGERQDRYFLSAAGT